MVVIGVLFLLFGLLFMFQGLVAVEGSPMTNSNFWAGAGPVIAVAGLVLAAVRRLRCREAEMGIVPRHDRHPSSSDRRRWQGAGSGACVALTGPRSYARAGLKDWRAPGCEVGC